MSANQQTHRIQQHKDRRDKATGKLIADLKKENQQLKREAARLSKRLAKFEAELEEKIIESEVAPPIDQGLNTSVMKCKSCSSVNVALIQLPTGPLFVCKDCNFRSRK